MESESATTEPPATAHSPRASRPRSALGSLLTGCEPEDAAAATALTPGTACPVCEATLDLEGTGVRCDRCSLVVRELPSAWQGLRAALATLAGGALVAWLALPWTELRGPEAVLGMAAVGAAALAPLLAFLAARGRWKAAATAIAVVREHWVETGGLAVDAQRLLDHAAPGTTCPVCDRAPLEGSPPGVLFSRGRLRCPRCRLDLAASLTPLGFTLGIALAAALVVGGGWLVVRAREIAGPDFLLRAGGGLLLVGLGLSAGFALQGQGDELALRELERSKIRFERRRRGVRLPDDSDAQTLAWFQENVEGIVVAVILFLVVRHFVLELFVIPTGSMAPSLLGNHFQVECKTCRYSFAVQKQDHEIDPKGEDVTAHCPLCGTAGPENEFTFGAAEVKGGDKILVNKFVYRHQQPERWDVVVFKFPKSPSRNYIKRLVGLPGESLKVDARGDVWTKAPGSPDLVLVRKPRRVQDELWMPVARAAYPDPKGSQWKVEPELDAPRWDFPHGHDGSERLVARAGTGDTWVRYSRAIKDEYGYDPPWRSGDHLVGDVRVTALATASSVDTGAIRLQLRENDRVLEAEIPVVGQPDETPLTEATLTENGERVAWGFVPPIRPGHPTRVELAYADERCWLRVGDQDVLSWDDPHAPATTESSTVRLGCGAGGATFADVALDRDIYYAPYGRGRFDPTSEPVEIPGDSYFMMGDNSPSSADSRDWGFVRRPLIVGRAFLVWWPLEQVKLIR